MLIDLTELQKDLHKNACDKGWWETERDYREILCLIHSEVSEGLEDYRKGIDLREVRTRQKDGKPEGFPTELADIVIRCCDVSEHKKWKIIFKPSKTKVVKDEDVPKKLNEIHNKISRLSSNWRIGFVAKADMNNIVKSVFELAEGLGINLLNVVKNKHDYNSKREFRHGGKKC